MAQSWAMSGTPRALAAISATVDLPVPCRPVTRTRAGVSA